MLTILLLPVLLAAPTSADELPPAESFAAAGEALLKRATTSAEQPLTDLQSAHTSFDSAYLIASAPVYLCRALAVAELTLRTATFADEQERLFWEETRQEDLERLQQDAATTGRANCRFDPAGGPARPRIALLTDADFPAGTASTPHADPAQRGPLEPQQSRVRRSRAHTAAGAMFTGAGVGLLGLFGGVLELERQRAVAMWGLIRTAETEGRKFTEIEARRFRGLADELIRGRTVAIGVGVAGLVSLGTGIALLATRKQAKARAYALHPYGGPQGAGALLRLKF